MQVNVKKKFINWLSTRVSSSQLSELHMVYKDIESLCIRDQILTVPLFETTDFDILQKVSYAIRTNRKFRLLHFRRIVKMKRAMEYYVRFLNENSLDILKHTERNNCSDASNDAKNKDRYQDISNNEAKFISDMKEFEETLNIKTWNFATENVDYMGQIPISISYFGDVFSVDGWTEAFVGIIRLLLDDYPTIISGMVGFHFTSIEKEIFVSNSEINICSKPNKLIEELYLETDCSTTEIVSIVRELMDRCNMDYENIEVGFKESCDKELKEQFPILYNRMHSLSKVYDDPQGMTVERILLLLGMTIKKNELIEFLDRVSWATKLSNEVYSFSRNIKVLASSAQGFNEFTKKAKEEFADFDKEAFISVLMSRYRGGMRFDSIDLENFRDTYSDKYSKKLTFTDEELEIRLRYCGIIYKDRLFPAEGVIDNGTKERLFSYIENKFADGNKVLYYKAIFYELSDAFAYCFSLTDEQMLKAYIEHTAEKGKYYFHSNYMSVDKNVKIDHSAEIVDYMLAAGKPLSYDKIYEGLSHISKDIIYREIRIGSKFVMNEKGHYFHIDIFEFSQSDGERIAEILNKEITDNSYAIWSRIFGFIQEQMPIFIENNLYLSSLGIRNALSMFMSDQFNFDGEVISSKDVRLGMADVYRLFAKHHVPFTDDDIYEFSKEVGTSINFWVLAEESVRVSKNLFVAKDQVEFDVEATDKALETYLSSGYILVKDVDSFLVFPNVGYEWNEFLLESYLLHYSKKFCLVNNGISLNNVAGAVAKKDGKFTQFVDICAQALADSSIELKKTVALNYLAEINLITRRSYKELDIAMTKARQIRNRKG